MSLEVYWKYISHETEFLKYRTEFAGDADRQGVAISRMCQHLAMVCGRIVDGSHPLVPYLNRQKFDLVKQEATRLMPHFKGLVASQAQKQAKRRRHAEHSQAEMMTSAALGKSLADVSKDAKVVYAWLQSGSCPLREFLSAVSDGGAFFTSNVHAKTGKAYIHHRVVDPDHATAGVAEGDFVRAIQGRLCD